MPGFDNDLYLRMQSEHIRDRIRSAGGKLYLEFGGKLFDDYHASRVLPGFMPDSKIRMLMEFGDQAEAIIAISAEDIVHNKVRKDFGVGYDMEALRLVDSFHDRGIPVCGIVITRYNGQAPADEFQRKAEALGLKVYRHYPISGYPSNVDLIASDDGYGRDEFVKTTRPLVVVTAPGPGSGKMAVCLSQLYNENRRGVAAGYAKFETFPIWNIPLNHPVNIAYEAATLDLKDVNMIDPFHLEAYGKTAINYNRDIEIFPVLNALFEGIYGENPYKSPTDMGVNMVGNCICDDDICCKAANDEIIRRYYTALDEMADGKDNESEVGKIALLLKQARITTEYRRVTVAAKQREATAGNPSAAIELSDGTILSAETSDLLGPCAALLLKATKHLAGIDHSVKLIPGRLIEPIQKTKVTYLHGKNPRLHTDEVLIALSVLSPDDENCRKALDTLPLLKGCQVHSTVLLSDIDKKVFKKLGVDLTCEPVHERH